MELQQIFDIVVSVAGFLAGWVLNNITKTMERLDKDIRNTQREYVTKEDYHRDIDAIKEMCKQIFDKLDNKADK
jgi:flagellar biosynthesis/type III secretory pathway chaperone